VPVVRPRTTAGGAGCKSVVRRRTTTTGDGVLLFVFTILYNTCTSLQGHYMTTKLLGIHHVTAITSDSQKNVDFYVGVLGLRLVKKTVNFDEPESYHLYYGDLSGTPGTILTFFPWASIAPQGFRGTGQVATVAFSLPRQSLRFWVTRLKTHGISFTGPIVRFEEDVISFEDPDGMRLELVFHQQEQRQAWKSPSVLPAHAIRGIFGVRMMIEGYEESAQLLTKTLGFQLCGEQDGLFRFNLGEEKPGMVLDVECKPDAPKGRMGIGTVHHVAWRIGSEEQLQIRKNELSKLHINATPIVDRKYYRSLYFREPGNVLFEMATDAPGFLVDEPLESLGSNLCLPKWLEGQRGYLERSLPVIAQPS